MNIQALQTTWGKIEAEAKFLYISTSRFVRDMIFAWRDGCETREIPKFENRDTIITSIHTDTEQRKAIKDILITYNLTHKQLIEAAWAWYIFCRGAKRD